MKANKGSVACIMSDVATLLEQANVDPGTWYVANDLANVFFSIPNQKEYQKQFVSFELIRIDINVLPQVYVKSPTLAYN